MIHNIVFPNQGSGKTVNIFFDFRTRQSGSQVCRKKKRKLYSRNLKKETKERKTDTRRRVKTRRKKETIRRVKTRKTERKRKTKRKTEKCPRPVMKTETERNTRKIRKRKTKRGKKYTGTGRERTNIETEREKMNTETKGGKEKGLQVVMRIERRKKERDIKTSTQ